MMHRSVCIGILLAVGATRATMADDWPTYSHDNARSGVTSGQLTLPLVEVWRHQATHAPAPAWPAPAPSDYWHGHRKLRPVVTYDRAYHAVVAAGALFFGSSSDDKVYALDASSGEPRWTFFTEGPIRLAPVFANGKVYVGSDDGAVYCLDATDGNLLWKFKTYDQPECVPGNGRMISRWPVRAGLVVDAGKVYFGAGLFPREGTYLFALDAESGKLAWKHPLRISPQGYMLASSQRLYVPTGRTTPTIFARADGAYLGRFRGEGGAYALLTEDTLITGPGRGEKQIAVGDVKSRETLATFGGLRMIVDGQTAYMQSENELSAFDRGQYLALARQKNELEKKKSQLTEQLTKTPKGTPAAEQLAKQLGELRARLTKLAESQRQCDRWKVKLDAPFSLLLAGNTLVAGGDNKVVALDAKDGKTLCSLPIVGKAYGLSAADDRLYVSTDQGVIHCLGSQPNGQTDAPSVVAPAVPANETGERITSCRKVVQWILGQTKVRRGYCLLLGCEDGQLACELAKQTSLRIVCIEPDPKKVAAARRLLDRAGYYGTKVSVLQGALDRLPYPDFFANLIVSCTTLWDATLPPSKSELFRVLRPCGGIAYVGQMDGDTTKHERLARAKLSDWVRSGGESGWTIHTDPGPWAELRRGPLPGSGQWTHLYADAAHSACSVDTIRGPMRIQWFGKPGPRHIVDRHHRPMSPLYKDGRLFVLGDNRVITVDAYNGTPLWEQEVPESRRVGVMKDCGSMVVTDRHLLIASGGQCWGLNVADGTQRLTFSAPQSGDGPGDWGFLDCTGDSIIGSVQKKGASFSALAFHGDPDNGSEVLEGDFRQVIISDALFSLDRRTSKTSWLHDKGAIMNSTITVANGRIFFAESRNPEIVSDTDGRIRIDRFCEKDLYLVALDLKTGQTVWEREVRLPFQHIMFLSYADKTLVCTGTSNDKSRVNYDMFAFDADGGEQKWHTPYQALDVRGIKPAPTKGSHGEQWQHPVINGGTIYCRPFAFDLATGKKKAYTWPRGGHGCGGVTGSAYCLFGRGSNPRYYPLDVPRTSGIRLTEVTRPGCWVNIIPAGGLVLIPESSSGCTCDYPVQTSLAFAAGEANSESSK